MAILFCHGLESAPHGRKYHALRAAGMDVLAPDFRGMNLAARVDALCDILQTSEPCVIVGSSYGGIAAVCATMRLEEPGNIVAGMLLCAPALASAEAPATTIRLRACVPTIIIHGTRDAVVPIDLSRDFAAAHPDEVELIEVDDQHDLSSSLHAIVRAARSLL